MLLARRVRIWGYHTKTGEYHAVTDYERFDIGWTHGTWSHRPRVSVHKTTEQSTRMQTRPTVVRWTCTTQRKVPQGPFWKKRVTNVGRAGKFHQKMSNHTGALEIQEYNLDVNVSFLSEVTGRS